MKQVPDRKKLRREYLRKKASGYFRGAAGIVLLVPLTSVFFLMVVATTGGLYHMIATGSAPLYKVLIASCITLILGKSIRRCWQARHEFKRTAQIPYVPPVNPDILPADEILVRGSEEPPFAQREVLLRGAQAQETPKEELLRMAKE